MSGLSRPPRRGDPIATAHEMRTIDRRAIEDFGVPAAVLMENAGRGCAQRLERLAADGRSERSAVVVCGPGNNGGDGLVVARTLTAWGWRVVTWFLGDATARVRLSSEARLQWGLAGRLGIAPRELVTASQLHDFEVDLARLAADRGVAVDALFGTGLARPITGLGALSIEALRTSGADVLAIDVPSGLDSETGAVHGVVVEARFTSTLAALKPGLFLGRGPHVAGEIELVEIGLPSVLLGELPVHAG